jgi:hypothetical protein
LLRSGSDATYWAALDSRNELCLVVALPDPAYNGSACTSPTDFSKVALAFRLLGPTSGAEAYLVPDAARPIAAKASVAASADSNDNLVVANPLASSMARSALTALTSGYNLGVLDVPSANSLPPMLQEQLGK